MGVIQNSLKVRNIWITNKAVTRKLVTNILRLHWNHVRSHFPKRYERFII